MTRAAPLPRLLLAIATPFDASGEVDLDRFEALLERYIALGVPGFVTSSGTGMHVYLTREESEALTQTACRVARGRAAIVAQTSALPVNEVLARSQSAAAAGADGLMVLPPFFEGPTDDDGVYDFYAGLDDIGCPVIGYNVPDQVGVAISPDLLTRLSGLQNFYSVKDSSGDAAGQLRLLRTGQRIINGCDPLALAALRTGVAGLIWGGANFAPRSCLALVQAADAGDWSEAEAIWTRLEAAMLHIWAGDYVPSVYAAAAHLGYDFGTPRAPLRALEKDKERALFDTLEPLTAYEKE